MSDKIIKIKAEILNATQESSKIIAQAVADASHKLAEDAALAVKVIANAKEEALRVSNKESNSSGFSNILYKQISLGMSVISLVGIVLGGFIYLTNPTNDNDTALQLQDQRITSQQMTIDDLNLTMQNDTKELKNEVAGLRAEIQVATGEIIKLSTIINERIPVKK